MAPRAYKEITLQQLRSFCETARLGSFKAAGTSLGLAQPTVWAQVHALERRFAVKLVEPYGRGCRLTPSGAALLEHAAPLLTGIGTLKQSLVDSQAAAESHVKVATTPRILSEDLPEAVDIFEKHWPEVHLTFNELNQDEVIAAVRSGRVDLGLTTSPVSAEHHPWLTSEDCYELEVILVTLPDHPLAQQRRIRISDLGRYPLVTGRQALTVPRMALLLEEAGAFDHPARRVETYFHASICRFVELGHGIGITFGLPGKHIRPTLHQRPLTSQFGRVPVIAVYFNGAILPAAARNLIRTIKELLYRPPQRRRANVLAHEIPIHDRGR
jgi:DNA-binding transcriptional LysR family regulator